ncbi:hypothetical protein LEP1GSC041_3679 [Leptospira noguchii str. 2006001870]|uniref:Uncharacterized protein n=1 Tax=Leptospira noguchii serovar Autumnalis str. ZUN142 TaxID=1085540 RepID=M6U6Q1_9LEPT|nr:hypothetical protein LEP1GSC041_3679 [Leptospira noguchii str. 2006001870]EMO40160.1 hypothetical protein LEP1GSC186_4792 [Leptospira noguchii serovar Autumnalis str. ZUN142]
MLLLRSDIPMKVSFYIFKQAIRFPGVNFLPGCGFCTEQENEI